MPAQLVDLNQSAVTCDATGGIVYSWLVEAKFITAITLTGGQISNFTMSTPGKWVRFSYDTDSTANYAQTPNRNGKRRTYQQVAFMKFAAIDAALITAANDAVLTCDIVAIHVLVNGVRMVQGLNIDAAGAGGFNLSKIQQTLLMAGAFTDTSGNESRVEFTLQGEDNTLSPITTLNDAAIAAL